MRRAIIALAFIAIVVSGAMLPEVRSKARLSINKLQKTKFGQNVLAAIQLELSSSNNQNIVDNILQLLNDLLGSTQANLSQTESDLADKQGYCDSTLAHEQDLINQYSGDIAQANQDLPNERNHLESLNSQLDAENTALQVATQGLSAENEANDEAVAAYDKSTRHHNNLINGLTEARALIVQLQVTNLVQKTGNILAQLSDHRAATLKLLEKSSHRQLFNVLMQMAQDVGIQSNQSQVSLVISIIDDLLAHHQQALQDEADAEAARLALHNQAVNDFNAAIDAANSAINDLTSQIAVTTSNIETLEANIEAWTDLLNQAIQTFTDVTDACNTAIANYNTQIAQYNDLIDAIQQVIDIFNSNAIQDVKPFVLGQLDN